MSILRQIPSQSFSKLLFFTSIVHILIVVLPIIFLSERFWIVPVGVILILSVLFSVQRTIFLLVIITIVLPASILTEFILPGGLRLQEGVLVLAIVFGAIDWIKLQDYRFILTEADKAVMFFLIAVMLSLGIGYIYGNATTVIWRDVRFPLYYLTFFIITQFFDRRHIIEQLVPFIVLTGVIVALEYVLEFIGAINLSIGEGFVRVARLQGMVLPFALLFIVSEWVFSSKKWNNTVLLIAFIPMGIAFVLTVGRSMWAAFALGLISIGIMHGRIYSSHWIRSVLLIGSVLVVLIVTVFSFQQITGASIDAQIFERSRTLIQYEENVHVLGRLFSYGVALDAIADKPLLGYGQGKTLMLLNFSEKLDRFEWVKAWTVDSLYLTILLKMGSLGLLAFSWMYIWVMRLAWRTFHNTSDSQIRSFCSATFSTFLGLAVLGLGNASLINGRFAIIYAILMGCVAVVSRQGQIRISKGK